MSYRVNGSRAYLTKTTLRRTFWQERALCGSAPEKDREVFTGMYPNHKEAYDVANRYCHQCPVRTECLTWATKEPYFSGVAGASLFTVNHSSGVNRAVRPIPKDDQK